MHESLDQEPAHDYIFQSFSPLKNLGGSMIAAAGFIIFSLSVHSRPSAAVSVSLLLLHNRIQCDVDCVTV